jgi:hypothetical protein
MKNIMQTLFTGAKAMQKAGDLLSAGPVGDQ